MKKKNQYRCHFSEFIEDTDIDFGDTKSLIQNRHT